jgi:hypothetical protein
MGNQVKWWKMAPLQLLIEGLQVSVSWRLYLLAPQIDALCRVCGKVETGPVIENG